MITAIIVSLLIGFGVGLFVETKTGIIKKLRGK